MEADGKHASIVATQGREKWRRRRMQMEIRKEKSTPKGPKRRAWPLFETLISLFGWGLRLVGLYDRGVRNALDIRVTRFELSFEDLPEQFDGFRILQLSDLHVDALPLIDFCTFTLTRDDIEVIVFGKRRKTPDVPGVQEFG